MGLATAQEDRPVNTSHWLLYYAKHSLLICRIHGYAVVSLAGHLKHQHPDITRKGKAEILAQFSDVELRRPPSTEFQHGPSNPRPPIDGLPVYGGWFCDKCDFLTVSRKRLRVHYNEAHRSNAHTAMEPTVSIQTLFTQPKSAVHYFCVAPPGAGPPEKAPVTLTRPGKPGGQGRLDDDNSNNVIAEIQGQWAAQQAQQEEMQRVLADGAAKHEVTNWLKRAGWTAHFTGRDLSEIYSFSIMPGYSSKDAALCRLVTATDKLFYSRCIEGLRSLPLMTRLILASPHAEDAHSRPFGPLQEKTSMDRNLTYWKRFLVYCLRVVKLDEAALAERHGFRFSPDQRRSLTTLAEKLQDEARSDEEVGEEVLQVSASFWMQRLSGDPFESPLWHFVAVLGIDGESVQLRPAHLFTYVLAGLVYVARALIAEHAVPVKARPAMEDLESRFSQAHQTWLCKATYTPIGYVLSLLLYGRKIARETGSRLMVSWSKTGDLMHYMGRPVLMDSIRSMVARLITDAEELLWTRLMFKEGSDTRFAIPLTAIEDDLTLTQRGKSFIHSNSLGGREADMLRDLVRSSRKADFLDGSGGWVWTGIRKYLELVRRFEQLLAVATQMSWGGPARGNELGGLRLVNGINRDRGVFVIDGEVMLVTQYHKSLAHQDTPKVIPRFLPARLGQLFMIYMVYVRPLTDCWEADRSASYGGMKPSSDFIWHDENGPWDSARISAAMAKWTYYYMGTRLTLQDWRHIAIATSRRHARQRGARRADFHDHGAGASPDDDPEGTSEGYEVPDDLAAAHTTRTSSAYGVTVDILRRLTADSIDTFREVSHRWHQFLGLREEHKQGHQAPATKGSTSGAVCRECRPGQTAVAPTTEWRPGAVAAIAAGAIKREREVAEVGADIDRLAIERHPKTLALPGPTALTLTPSTVGTVALEGLRAIMRDDQAQFRSPQQEAAVCSALLRKSPLVAVLPTGGGQEPNLHSSRPSTRGRDDYCGSALR